MPQDAPIKCLIVDDVPENLTALEALLQREGLLILKAQSGREALELLLTHGDVALALLDVQMPEMNGFELAELIRGSERTKQIPLIFMTAGSREQHWQFRGYETGAVDFLYKPLDPRTLVSKAEVFFELHRRKLELVHELRERTEALRINEMFMAVLSHDLRTPLSAVATAAMLLQRQPDGDRVATMADRILRSSRRMASMIEDLLDVTRVRQAGGLEMHRAPASMDALVQRTLDELQTSAPGACIEFTHVGDQAGHWDGDRICQVLVNLISNAVQHGDPGRAIRVSSNGARADGLVLTVSNAGTIPADLMDQLFVPFRGRERPPGRHQGLGLGLFIADNIVRAHGGRIEARSEGGETQFCVRLPRGVEAARQPAR